MKIKIKGYTPLPPCIDIDEHTCERCTDKTCEDRKVVIARTMIGYFIKLFIMRVLYDYIEVINLEAEGTDDHVEDDCEWF